MGNMTKWMKGSLGHGGSSQLSESAVLAGMSNGFSALSEFDYSVTSPAIHHAPITATVAEARQATHEVSKLASAVANGRIVMDATAKKVELTADLAVKHRSTMERIATSNLRVAKANTQLASTLQNQRGEYAKLGMGLNQTVENVNHRIDVIAAKYGHVTK